MFRTSNFNRTKILIALAILTWCSFAQSEEAEVGKEQPTGDKMIFRIPEDLRGHGYRLAVVSECFEKKYFDLSSEEITLPDCDDPVLFELFDEGGRRVDSRYGLMEDERNLAMLGDRRFSFLVSGGSSFRSDENWQNVFLDGEFSRFEVDFHYRFGSSWGVGSLLFAENAAKRFRENFGVTYQSFGLGGTVFKEFRPFSGDGYFSQFQLVAELGLLLAEQRLVMRDNFVNKNDRSAGVGSHLGIAPRLPLTKNFYLNFKLLLVYLPVRFSEFDFESKQIYQSLGLGVYYEF